MFSKYIQLCTNLLIYILNKRRGQVVNIPASYSGGTGFKSQHRDRLSRLMIFVVFLSPSRRMQE
jgi:hypothetical protein